MHCILRDRRTNTIIIIITVDVNIAVSVGVFTAFLLIHVEIYGFSIDCAQILKRRKQI